MDKTRRSGFVAILKKELTRFFTDRRMVLTTILLPGVMIFAIYYFIGDAMNNLLTVEDDYTPQVYAVNIPADIVDSARGAGLPFEQVALGEIEGIKERITDQEVDLLVVFPEDFILAVNESGQVPDIEVFYNSARTESSTQNALFGALLESYRDSVAPAFTVNAVLGGDGDLVSEKDEAGMLFAMLLPFLIMIFLFTGAMGIASESIAGEKERGTFATMLITPLKRWELALGKIVSISIIALLSGLSSFVGVMLSLPRMMGSAEGMDASIYTFGDYALLLAIVLSTVLLFVGLISVISAFARTIKEAAQLLSPLMIVVMLITVLGGFMGTSASDNLLLYLVPVYNSVQCLVGVFSFSSSVLPALLTVGSNLVFTGVCIIALTRMFGSERIIFSR